MTVPAETSEVSALSRPSASPPTPTAPAPSGPRPLPVAPQADLPETRRYRIKTRMLGRPLATDQLAHERLGKPTALAVFASDNLSSTAYATEEILRGARAGASGSRRFRYLVPITVAMMAVLTLLILSYRQTIKAYPSAGGAYIVTKDNLGLLPAQVAGVALLTDYILTVSVSVSAGVAAHVLGRSPACIRGACRSLWRFIVIIAWGNLRGVKESGRIFAVPDLRVS